MYCTPGPLNSILINTEKAVPNKPENIANIKYNTPISFAFVEKNHLSVGIEIEDLFNLFKCLLPSSKDFIVKYLKKVRVEIEDTFVLSPILLSLVYFYRN